jgi:antitoxin YefM
MTMLSELNFSEARSKLTEIVDRAQRYEIPVIRPRKKSEDYSVIVRGDLLKLLLSKDQCKEFSVEIFNEDDGSVTISVAPFEIAVNGETRNAAMELAVAEVIDYANEYMDPENFPIYSRSPNRRTHLVLVTKILLCDSPEQVKGIIGLA